MKKRTKQLIAMFLSLVLLLGTLPTSVFAVNTVENEIAVADAASIHLQGDANGDGRITSADLVIIARYIVGVIEYVDVEQYCDMNDDGRVTNVDLIMIARIIVGIEPGDSVHTVTFDSNGGSEIDSIEAVNGATISAPSDPVKEGYIFIGWYTSADFDEIFLFDDDIITEDTTLYAAWVYDDEDAILVEYAARQIEIEYQQGDNSRHVTKDVTLQTEIEGIEGIMITWSSSSSAISTEGVVTRPQGVDEEVTLTATVSKNEASYSVDFSLNVIHENNRNRDEITNNSVVDIENMNPDGGAEISYNDDKSQVTSIEGKYSDIKVENADDALDVIQNIHTIIGVNDPYKELEILIINSDEYGAEYTFAQEYNGYIVYGRRITVSADENGVSDFLSSGVYASEKLGGISSAPQITAETAEASVKTYYGGECTVDSERTILAFYTLNEHEDAPVLTYMVYICGTNEEGNFVDDTVFVDATTGAIICSITNVIDASSEMGSGKNELGKKVSFPVSFSWTDWYFYYMQDLGRNIQMYEKDFLVDFRIGSEFNWWTNKTAVSAYTNIIKTYDWYKNNLYRDSLDNNGLDIKVIVDIDYRTDNAFWSSSNLTLNFCDNSLGSSLATTTAAALDIAAHEYTHGIVHFVTGGLPYVNAPGAINEGYADIFGCLIDGDWQIGEDWRLLRDASNPTAYGDPDKMSSSYYIAPVTNPNDSNDYGGVHRNSSLVYHAAYLMTEYGMSKTTLAKLWYKSLSMGYDSTSTFQTVRKNVLKAAKKIGLSDGEIAIIKKAFDEVEIFGDRGTLSGTVSDTDGNRISGATVKISLNDSTVSTITTDANGTFSTLLDEDTYFVSIAADGFIEHLSTQQIEESVTTTLNVILVGEGQGVVSGNVVSATSALALEDVSLNVRTGLNMQIGDVIATSTTDVNGRYSFELDAGYYTIEMLRDGYTTGYINVQLEGGKSIIANGSLSPIMTSDTYRVVLTWGASPSDLDSHLTGTADDGTSFHVYWSDRSEYKVDGTEIANLDVDDITGYGPETTTFKAETDGDYYFYVHRFSSNGSLPASNATVRVYNGDNLIAEYTIDSSASSNYRYWNVFKIENGIFYTVNTVSSSHI